MNHSALIRIACAGLLVATAACRPPALYMIDPPGPREYKLGWEDGCDTGVASVSGMVYKSALGFKKRPEFFDNQLYNTGWNEGFSYCRFSMDEINKGSPFK